MAPNPKNLRAQMALIQPLLSSCSIKTMRKGQNMVGELMGYRHKDNVILKGHNFNTFSGSWIIPKDQRRQGVILYLHGGGYTCGDLDYATGFGATLAVEFGCRVFCPAYRLAPETPFPGALEDALEAYLYLLDKGYSHIALCGESAGGGLCYSLCLKLKEIGRCLPSAVIAISPWMDLTMAGQSIASNKDSDVSLTEKQLRYFAQCYTEEPSNPLVSALFGDLKDLPPSLIFAAKEEILLSDSQRLKERLIACGCRCKLHVKQNRWHAYLLYGLQEDRKDMAKIDQFLDRYLCRAQKLRWMRLDNAAKIYPAARNQNWSSIYRLSATFMEAVDRDILSSALDITVRRFPSIAVRLRKGVFWYYLEQLDTLPPISREWSFPLTPMGREEVRKCAFRVIVFDNRIAIEMFHSITDGTGALVFLKTLTAEYLKQKYNIPISASEGVLGRLEEPSAEEMEDSFLKYAGKVTASRQESTAWRLSGTPELGGFQHLTSFTVPVRQALDVAHSYHASLTCFLTSALLMALQNMQAQQVSNPSRRKPLKVQIPVNLRNIFPSRTMRNFAFYTTPEIDPRLGRYTMEEICAIVKHRMGLEITPKQLSMRIATNVGSEKLLIVRLMPLFIKNIVMKAVFKAVGEKKACLSMSNLGAVTLPEEMLPYVERMDFILGVQESAPHNCGVLSFKDSLYINFIRDIQEADLEYHFFCVLRDLGLPVSVQSNTPPKKEK